MGIRCYLCRWSLYCDEFLKIIQSNPCNFKLKGSGPFFFHLGCEFNEMLKEHSVWIHSNILKRWNSLISNYLEQCPIKISLTSSAQRPSRAWYIQIPWQRRDLDIPEACWSNAVGHIDWYIQCPKRSDDIIKIPSSTPKRTPHKTYIQKYRGKTSCLFMTIPKARSVLGVWKN